MACLYYIKRDSVQLYLTGRVPKFLHVFFLFRGARCSCVIVVFRVSFFLGNGRSFRYNLHSQQNLVNVMPIGVFH